MNRQVYQQWWKWLVDNKALRRLIARTVVIAVPYGWHILFFLVPFIIILKISFSESIIGIPPYTQLISWIDQQFLQIRFNFGNYALLLEDRLYLHAYLESIRISGLATLLCLFIAYPIAYGLSRMRSGWRTLLLMLIILPFWISFLIRVYAWLDLLSYYGPINSLLMKLGLTAKPLSFLYNDISVCLGIVYSYLPFMIFPLFVALDKIDSTLLEAAYDLGCKPWQVFYKITLPLSLRGVVAGSMLVFIPGVGEYVIPELLGGADNVMIGRILWTEFFTNGDWSLASALAIIMLLVLVLPIIILQNNAHQRKAQ